MSFLRLAQIFQFKDLIIEMNFMSYDKRNDIIKFRVEKDSSTILEIP